MRIDKTIYAAINDGTLTREQFLLTLQQASETIETSILDEVAAQAIAAGFNADDIRAEIAARAIRLCEGRPHRLETVRQMLEAGATNLQ